MSETTNDEGVSSGERIVIAGGLLVGLASLLPWYRADRFGFGPDRTNGWQEPDAILSQSATVVAVVVAVAVAVLLARRGAFDRVRLGSWSWGTILTGAAAAATGLLLLKFALNLERTTVGPYLALTGAVTMLYGAYVTRLDEPPGTSRAAPPSASGADADPRTTWPETAYLLAAHVQPADDITTAVGAYLATFSGEPDRVDRLRAELHDLAGTRTPAERTALVEATAPRWAPHAEAVLAQLRSGVAVGEAPA